MRYKVSRLDANKRARQKRAAREEDARRLAAGEVSRIGLARENGFFAGCDLAHAEIVAIGNRPVHLK